MKLQRRSTIWCVGENDLKAGDFGKWFRKVGVNDFGKCKCGPVETEFRKKIACRENSWYWNCLTSEY